MIDWWTKNRSKISWHLPRYFVKILVKLIFLHIEYGSQSSMKRNGSGESGFVDRSDPKWIVPELQPGYWSGATSHQCCGAGADFLRRLRLFNLYKDKYDPEHNVAIYHFNNFNSITLIFGLSWNKSEAIIKLLNKDVVATCNILNSFTVTVTHNMNFFSQKPIS